MQHQIDTGAQDDANELGYRLTGSSVRHDETGDTIYGFGFDARGQHASVEFAVNNADIVMS